MPYAMLTPSYAGDLERCRLLAESVSNMVANVEHFILVDDIDLAAFSPLREFGATIVDARELLHPSFHRIPTTRLWLTSRGRVLRGWITQQIRKLAFSYACPHENILCVDSDVVFVRTFDPEALTKNDQTPLFEIDWTNAANSAWADQSRRLLGMPVASTARGYVHPTFWRKSVVKGLLSAVEEAQGQHWQHVLAKQSTLSEYVLYGTYAREYIGLAAAQLYSFNEPLMHVSWDYDLSDQAQLDKFIEGISEENVAAMFHSKDRVPVSRYEESVRRYWSRHDQAREGGVMSCA